jgi:hypothetical protein
MAGIGNPPTPLPPNVPRYDTQGRPLRVQVEYERRVVEWLTRLAALVPGALAAEAVSPAEFRRRSP